MIHCRCCSSCNHCYKSTILKNKEEINMQVTNKGIDAMEMYGGSFVKALANAWCRADPINKRKLEETFDYFENYERQAIRRGIK